MFTRIFYDNYKNRLYCIENVDGKRHKIDFHPTFEYYVPDPTGQSDIKDIYGNPVKLQVSETRKGMKEVAACTKTCETQISEDVKFLQKRYAGKKLDPDISNFQVATWDIEVASKKEFPKPEEAKFPINLISIHYSKEDKVYTFGTKPYTGDSPLVQNYHYCPDEKTMLERFIKHFRRKLTDILTGWNISGFDVPYFINRCKVLGIDASLSPLNIYKERRNGGYHIEGGGYVIAGISILDGLELYKNFVYTKKERYSLQFIGKEEVGEGKKDLDGTVNTAWEDDWDNFVEYNVQDVLLVLKIENVKKHIELAVNFCYQALIPFERIFSSISLVTGFILKYMHERNIVMSDKENFTKDKKFPGAYVMAKPGFYEYVVSFDIASMYPHEIITYNISPETLVMNPDNPEDYYSCPLSEWKTWETSEEENFECGGIYYRKDIKGILPQIVSDVYEERKIFKKKEFIADAISKGLDLSKYPSNLIEEVKKEGYSSKYYHSQQLIRKIYINSVYGVIGNPHFCFFNINNAIAVTLGGQDLIRYLSNTINSYMKQNWHKVAPKLFPEYKGKWKQLKDDLVILIDTDSNFVCLQEIVRNMGLDEKFSKDRQAFMDWVKYLEEKFFNPFFDKILNIYAEKYGVPQLIDFKREKIVTQKFILAKKKYADELIANEDKVAHKDGTLYVDKPYISITGIEVVKTDTPKFSRERIMSVIEKIFEVRGKDRDVVMKKLRKIHDEFLDAHPSDIANPTGIKDYQKYAKPVEVYLKNKEINYPKHLPIHVRAAMNYNFTLAKNNLPLMPVNNGTKMKYIYVAPHKNELHQNVIGFINEWPKEFDELFYVDIEAQWNKVFQKAIQRFFNVLDWGEIEIEENTLSDLIQF
ncbi:MAG: DNA polymerase domain-containing protein [bacterium]